LGIGFAVEFNLLLLWSFSSMLDAVGYSHRVNPLAIVDIHIERIKLISINLNCISRRIYFMHHPIIRPHVVDRLLARRGKLHWFDALDPKRTALIVVDMQSTFCEPGSPAEVPESRNIVQPINHLARELRARNIPIFWILHANTHLGSKSDWEIFFNHVVHNDVRTKTIDSLMPGKQTVWRDLETSVQDIVITKNRYSALIPGSSTLENMLRNYGVDTLLIAGTKTNVCCESTGRDAMMLDFKVVMISDCCAALSEEEHRVTLETFIQQFGDVMTATEVLEKLNDK